MSIAPWGRGPSGRGWRWRLVQVGVGIGVIVSVVVVSLAAAGSHRDVAAGTAGESGGGAPVGSRSPTRNVGRGLPTLGSSRVVERDDVGDPFVLTVPAAASGHPKARYVLYWTTDWQSNVPTAVSSDLVHWRRVADSRDIVKSCG